MNNNNTTYKKIEGKDLIQGNTYYLDNSGVDKAIYRGILTDGAGEDRCLFSPIGHTQYYLYDDTNYGGGYEGMFSLWNEGFFYEKVDNQ